jgi:hypothetical protein
MSYSDFKKKIIKANENHNFTVTNSNGTKNAWRWIKKNKWLDIGQEVTEREFGLIIKAINQTLQDQLISGKDVTFPHRMGRLEIRKFKAAIEFRDGKLVTNLPVDWERTLKLWYEDSESHKAKTLVRYESPERFTIYYNRDKALYNNKSFYQFIPTRVIKRRLKDRIAAGNYDALLLGKKNGIR